MLHADGARKALSRLPARQPKRLNSYNMLQSYASSVRLRRANTWLHALHGDPIAGRSKREIREELGLVSKDKEAQDSEYVGIDLSKLEAVVENPTPHGMPLQYLEGLSETHFTAASRSARDDTVVVRFEVNGLHTKPLLGVEPTGRFVELAGITWLKFDEQPTEEGGVLYSCTDYWAYWDLPALMEQLDVAA